MTGRQKTIEKPAVFAAALIVAVGGLIYELILGTAASYLFGDSITSFSVSTGLTLFGMGIGSLAAARFARQPGVNFVRNELLLSIVGGNSVILLFAAFSFTKIYWLIFVLLSLAIGVFIGAEIPLLMSLVREYNKKRGVALLSKVLAADYFGALIASLLFPFLLLPYLGLIRSAYAVAIINTAIALYIFKKLKLIRRLAGSLYILSAVATISLVCGFVFATKIESAIHAALYQDPVVYYKFSPYQKLVLTHFKNDTRLYLNDQLQFSSIDEARYHETLAHTALTTVKDPKNVLILGGGDGLLAREVLRYKSVNSITIVDIDSAVTNLSKEHQLLKKLNKGATTSPIVKIVNQDALNYVRNSNVKYDAVLVDLVDPANEKVAKLYSLEFYTYANRVLQPSGVFITQATSPYFTPRAFWQIHQTILRAMSDKSVQPLGVNVPSFGEWGFVVAHPKSSTLFTQQALPQGLAYHNSKSLNSTTTLPNDAELARSQTPPISSLIEPRVYQTYQKDMQQWRF